MRGAFRISGIRGINIYIHWTFLFLLGWVLLVNAQLGNDIIQLSWSLIFLAAVFACVTLHELGHALMASRFGIKAKSIVLLPVGGIASIEKFPENPRQELAISIAGPLVSVAIALVLWLLSPPGNFWKLPDGMSITHGHDLIANLRVVNMSLALFNLIPAFPMDGGRIFRALLGFKLNYIRATTIAAAVGKIIAVAFIAVGILLINPLLPVIGLFIIFSASTEENYLRLKSLVKDTRLNQVVMYDYNSLQAGTTVLEAANVLENNHSKYFILMDGAMPVGSINRMEIVKAVAEMKYKEPIRNLIQHDLVYLDGAEHVDTVLEKLAVNDERIFPVMTNGQLTGVVNLNHIIEYLLLHKPGTLEFPRIKSLVGLLR